jgi:hypothetical protein
MEIADNKESLILFWKIKKRIYLFICCLFNDAVNSSDYIASDDRMINEYWVGKDTEGSGRGLI